MVAFQASLFDWDDDGAPETAVPPLAVERTHLADGAWVDVQRRWILGSDSLFERLRDTVPWHAERRPMYDRVVAVPRLLSFFGADDPLPDAALVRAKRLLDAHYGPDAGEPFSTAGLCLYRDGRDSVAWHGDRIGRSSTHDTVIAIVSLGCPRLLMLRPKPGGDAGRGRTLRFELGHGDLFVMGGSCQRTWEHAVPKTAKPVGPRISVQFRMYDVR